ncbi:MAG TPA: M48 family metallopeptidase [Phnomibacter sp.]|nr:M48 family metallopeptidase [Phnomibacter sp.]
MEKTDIQLTSEFKTQTLRAIFSIVVFVLVYLIILVLALGLTALCVVGGLYLIAARPMFLTIVLGAGLASLGILVLIFLIKFMFQSHKTDRSHLVEIHSSDEPELFKMIDEIVCAVKTSRPKKVYLSADVNAAVFYDSSFWSMFFPIKKNLQIGMGLVNTVSREELKAILSHEFGHFSQRTMKVGSYVYNVNQVIFNMLFDNDSYTNLVQRWGSVSGYFSIFISAAIKINQGIQWVLRKQYEVVNKSYLSLSREMEFHADEIAANITGFEPLKSSLLRMSLADASFDAVLNYYNGKIEDNLKSENLYREQTGVMNFLAERNGFSIKGNLPEISMEEQGKFDKSKLVIKNQWASHPSTEERIERLERLNISVPGKSNQLANDVFKNIEETQRLLTNKIFESVTYSGETKFVSTEEFQTEYNSEYLKKTFSKIYNGYYDDKIPNHFDVDGELLEENGIAFPSLFSDEKVGLVYTYKALQKDIETLKNIANNQVEVKTFDYDGVKYTREDSQELSLTLEKELEKIKELIQRNDIKIFEFFRKLEQDQDRPLVIKNFYLELFEVDKAFDAKYEIYGQLSGELEFVNVETPFEQIRANFEKIKPIEEQLMTAIKELLSDSRIQSEITVEMKASFELYLSETRSYFDGTAYDNDNLKVLYEAMNSYVDLLSRGYFFIKKRLLTYQEELIVANSLHDKDAIMTSGQLLQV